MIILIDNYDSFTYNLYHLLVQMDPDVRVFRNDAISVEGVLDLRPDAVVISPGPGRPSEAGICIELIRRAGGRIPMLGVCLGHQAMAEATGGRVIHAPTLLHGKTSSIRHEGTPLFRDVANPFEATRYHSLAVDPDALPSDWAISAWADDGVVMAIEHRRWPMAGVQFHPESILTREGPRIVENFLRHYAGWPWKRE
jgi:anthranilate synthase component 2